MKTLLKIEWRKVSRNRIFWAMLILYVVAIVIAFIGLQAALNKFNSQLEANNLLSIPLLPSQIYSFPHIWHNMAFVARFLKIFLGIVIIILVSNEFTYNTLRQNLITGLSRKNLVQAKFIDVVILSAWASLIILIYGTIAGFISTTNIQIWDVVRKLNYLGAYFLMSVSFMSFAMMLTFLIKKAAPTILFLLVYTFILEPLFAWRYAGELERFLPVKSMNALAEAPNTPLFEFLNQGSLSNHIPLSQVFIVLVYIAIFNGISYMILRKRDL